jgi:hypothetical protein
MSALAPIPQDCVTQGDVTPAMRQWMGSMLGDAIGFDNAISYIESTRAPLNAFIDGECQVAQGAALPLVNFARYGSVDMWAVWASGGVVTAGTVTQSAAVAGTSTQFAAAVAGLTLTGAGQISYRQRIESKIARGLVNQAASFSCLVRHGNPAPVPVVVVVRVANAVDNFAGVTTIYTSVAQNAAAAAALTTISVPNIAMGNCANGIEVEIQMQVGACTGSFTQLADAQLVPGAIVPPFLPAPFDVALSRVRRYFQKSFPYATAPAMATGVQPGQLLRQCVQAGAVQGFAYLPYIGGMRAQPTFVNFFNPISNNTNWRNLTLGADSGASGITASGEHATGVLQTQVAGDAVGNLCGIHWTMDARL